MRFLRILIISVLISLSSSYIIMSMSIFTSPDQVMNGRDLLEEVVIAIGLGIAISIVTLIFEVERIPFSGQLFVHFLGITACVFLAGYFGNWYDVSTPSTMMFVFLLIIIIYGLVWWFLQIVMKRDVEELNEKIKKRRGELE